MGCGASADNAVGTVVHTPMKRHQSIRNAAGISVNPFGGADEGGNGVWEYQTDPDDLTKWVAYGPDSASRLEEAHSAGKDECAVVLQKRLYTVNLKTMVQSSSGGANRSVRRRRIDAGPSGAFPIADGEEDDPSRMCRVGSVQLKTNVKAHEGSVYCVEFSPSGKNFITGSRDEALRVWDTDSGTLVHSIEGVHFGIVLTCSYTKGRRQLIVSGCEDTTCRIFSVAEDYKNVLSLHGHDSKVYAAKFLCDDRTVLTGSIDQTVRTWDVEKGQPLDVIHTHRGPVYACASGPVSPWMALTASDDKTLKLHDLRNPTGTNARTFLGHRETLWGCDISSDETQFVSCGMDGLSILWDARKEGEPLSINKTHNAPVHCIEFFPEGEKYITSSRDYTFKVTDTATGAVQLDVAAHTGNVYHTTYCPMNGLIATCSIDCCVKLWSYTA